MSKYKVFFIIISLSFLIFNCTKIDQEYLKAEKGVLDLTNWHFNINGNIKLNGEWEFYWNQLLEPLDFKKDIKPTMSGFIYVPKKWENFKINNKNINTFGYATYHLTIILDNKDIVLGLKIPTVFTSYTLWINDELLLTNGKVGKDRKTSKPKDVPKIILFNPASKKIKLTMQVSNFYDRPGGICYPIMFGEANQIYKVNMKNVNFSIFIYGAIIIFGFFYLCVFILRRNDKSTLFFSIFCFIIAIRGLFIGEYTFFYYFSDFPYELQKKIEFFTMSFGVPIFSLFLYSQYPKDISKKITFYFILSGLLYSIIVLVFSLRIYCLLLLYIQSIIVLLGIYIFIVLIKIIIKKRESSILFACGFIFFFIFVSIEILQERLKLKIGNYTPYGMFIFIFIQSFILSQKFSKAFSRVENYSYELENQVKKRTKQLEIANKDKTNFFVNIAHETKTPLTLINNYLDMYIKKYGITKELTIIKNNFKKLLNNMIYYLDSEKIERGKILYNHDQIIDFSNILNDQVILFSELAKDKDIKIEYNIEKNLFIKIDPDAIERIINNLLDNAIRHTESKGKIYLSLISSNNEVKFIVKDTGIGLNDEQKSSIFEPYYQVTNGEKNLPGIGMGLNIVKKIVDSVNAKVFVKSRLNEGTEFIIVFKKHNLSEKDKIIKKIKSDIKQGVIVNTGKELYKESRNNILIVEDNLEMLSYLKESMQDLYNIFYAINGKNALDKIKIIPKPNIIISDIMMEYMDGYQFFEELNKNDDYKNIPFIFLTAKTSKDEKIKGLTKGAIDFISKPFVIDELIAKIDSIIRIQEALKEDVLLKLSDKYYDILEKLETVKKEVSNNLPDNKDSFYKLYHEYGISKREIEIISLLKLGLEHKEIADKINISINTVRTYISRIHEKCKVNNKVDLLRIFRSN